MKNIDEFVKALGQYRDGEIKIDELEEVHQTVEAFPHFKHFLNDSDKRAENPAYSVMQEKALAAFIKLLRNNNYEEAEAITFLDKL